MGIPFYNILIDENASIHITLEFIINYSKTFPAPP